MASNGTDFRKTLSNPGLLREVRASFERIDDGVSGRKFPLTDYLMSGLAIFSPKYGSLLQFDRHAHEEVTIRFKLRSLFGGVQLSLCASQVEV